MKVVADAVLSKGGDVHGVITESLQARGHSPPGLTTHEIVPNLSIRKARMIELADAFIALPGGIGTIEELFFRSSIDRLLCRMSIPELCLKSCAAMSRPTRRSGCEPGFGLSCLSEGVGPVRIRAVKHKKAEPKFGPF